MGPDDARVFFAAIAERVDQRLFGVRRALGLVLIGILTDSHVLIDDVPGVGKTTLIRMLASLLGLRFARIQFTPDLMPSDVTGTSVLNLKTNEFEFRPGPVFTQVLLADEINRATPKTQAALLEAMQERQVTVDGVTYPLPEPFFVLATQNPVELEGTFPLPLRGAGSSVAGLVRAARHDRPRSPPRAGGGGPHRATRSPVPGRSGSRNTGASRRPGRSEPSFDRAAR